MSDEPIKQRGRPKLSDEEREQRKLLRKQKHAEYMVEYERKRKLVDPDYAADRAAAVSKYQKKDSTKAARKEAREARKAADPEGYAARVRESTARSRAKKRSAGLGNQAEIAWAKANREKINARRRHRYNTDPNYKLLACLRARLGAAFRNSQVAKLWDTADLTGCTLEHLRLHLERQFQPDMTWGTYGIYGWHIDHIRECSTFDLTDEAQARACFHYTNLQPL